MDELIQKIEELSVTFVMADLTDLQALADLYKRFEEIANLAETEKNKHLAGIAIAVSKLIEKIILDEVKDKNASIEAISQTLGAMQSIAVYNRNPNETIIPVEVSEFLTNDLDVKEENIVEKTEEKDQESIETTDGQESISNADNGSSSEQSVLIGDESLLADFIIEAREHLHEADVQLLTIESDPKNYDALNAVYRAFHTIKGVAGFLNLKDIATLAHATEDLLDKARKGELLLVETPIDVTFNAVDAMKQMISDVETALSTKKALIHNLPLSELLSAIKSASSDENTKKADTSKEETDVTSPIVKTSDQEQISKDNVEIDINETQGIDTNIMKIDQEIQETQTKEKSQVIYETKETIQQIDQRETQERQQAKLVSSQGVVKETIKIEAERLDRLVDMIGELVIAESMVTQDTEIMNIASARVSRNLAHLNKITRELQEIGMSLRMMPVRPIFERMARLARDLAKKSGKKIEFTMSGEDTELDKSVVEKISDPLTHMIRNAIDHGIESSPSERVKLGKSEIGHISLKAFHKGGDIVIEVSDDGRGLDKEAILTKAKERGIVGEDQTLSEQEIYNLIFMPGFSTAKVVTDVSGRGVGMDVVNRNVQALRGQVEIHSTVGKGATFMLRLPLTLAIMDGIIVQVGSEQYIIPTLSVVESIRPKPEEISTVMGNSEMLCIRGKFLPMFRISNLFQLHDAIKDPTEALIVVVEDEGKQVGFMVDSLVGHQQIVIKSLGESMGDLRGISGGAIMADGRVGLILDVAGIVKLAITGSSSSLAA
ncbi:MAG: chemotaxis protein CheA [Candidatus Poribacteria bacterium]